MPINIPNGLPAKAILESEKIFALEEDIAKKQDIRPLKVAILNLMPKRSRQRRRSCASSASLPCRWISIS